MCLPCFAEAKFARVLETFKRYPGESYTPSSTITGDVYENVKKSNMGIEFEHIDISKKVNCLDPIMVSVRKDPIGVVKRMFGSKEGRAVLSPGVKYDSEEQRVFNEMWTADKWLNDQVHLHTSIPCNDCQLHLSRSLCLPIQRTWGKDSVLVYIMFWSDKMNYDKAGRQTGHPMTISLGMYRAPIFPLLPLLHCCVC